MDEILTDFNDGILWITLNRIERSNAFDDALLKELHAALEAAEKNSKVRVVVLKANGRHFSAGADLQWMQRIADYSEQENQKDAQILADLMFRLYHLSKPTIAMVQGSAYGGGAGLVAACDIAIAADSAWFCFSEVKLGLIPAVISPYVVTAIGARAATGLFMSAEVFSAERAKTLHLVHYCVSAEELLTFTEGYARQITKNAPGAVCEAKALVRAVQGKAITPELSQKTAALIAQHRVSVEGRKGIAAFLSKKTPDWSQEQP